VTEKDLISIYQKMRLKSKAAQKDDLEISIRKDMKREEILDLILDCFNLDAVTSEVSLSMISLNARRTERA